MPAEPTAAQTTALMITERTTSVMSLLGTAFILSTFAYWPAFHKPINRLVVFASLGNIIGNAATLISTSGVTAGIDSPTCQFQAFVIQWFLPADALWTLSMACNVYLTFFKKYNAEQLRALEWKYFFICYGVPLIPGFVYLFINTRASGRIYGPAVLWCWISKPWDIMRIATFYGPVWIIMLATFTIYIFAGIDIFKKRRQLREFAYPNNPNAPPLIENPFTSTRTTEVKITRESVEMAPGTILAAPVRPGSVNRSRSSHNGYQPYSITIESNGEEPLTAPTSGPRLARSHSAIETNTAAWGYTRCAFFFFLAMLVTWVPSSINRVYGVTHPENFLFPLQWVSAFVLPLQGFWNSVIYIMTSLPACHSLWDHLTGRVTQQADRATRTLSFQKLRVAAESELQDSPKPV